MSAFSFSNDTDQFLQKFLHSSYKELEFPDLDHRVSHLNSRECTLLHVVRLEFVQVSDWVLLELDHAQRSCDVQDIAAHE